MRKKILIITGVIVIAIITILLITSMNKTQYVIKVSIVDDRSPDRILTVYNEKNEEIEVRRIETIDGVFLCNGVNTAVYFGNIENIDKLKVVLMDKSEVIAKVIKEEVK